MHVYLDNAATTPLHPKVFEAMIPYLKDFYGNPSSVHSLGTKVRVAIEDAREVIASSINAKAGEIYFLSGGTEAGNFVIRGIINSASKESDRKNLTTSIIEHHAILVSVNSFSEKGFNVKYPNHSQSGEIDWLSLKELLNDSTLFASIMNVNNELGIINDIDEISKRANYKKILFHSDCVQSFGKYKLDVKKLNIDSISGSAHKINGPKGIGFAYIKSGTPAESLILGGGQERNRRGGTENVAGIIGFAEAVRVFNIERENYFNHVKTLKQHFIKGLNQIDGAGIIVNSTENSSPYIVNISFSPEIYKADIEVILVFLDINGVAASGGSACASGTVKASHVLTGIGKSFEEARGTVRFSFGYQNNMNEIDYALSVIEKLTKQIKK